MSDAVEDTEASSEERLNWLRERVRQDQHEFFVYFVTFFHNLTE